MGARPRGSAAALTGPRAAGLSPVFVCRPVTPRGGASRLLPSLLLPLVGQTLSLGAAGRRAERASSPCPADTCSGGFHMAAAGSEMSVGGENGQASVLRYRLKVKIPWIKRQKHGSRSGHRRRPGRGLQATAATSGRAVGADTPGSAETCAPACSHRGQRRRGPAARQGVPLQRELGGGRRGPGGAGRHHRQAPLRGRIPALQARAVQPLGAAPREGG